MAFAAGAGAKSAAEINVTPLIDVLLVLLIIFMVIGPGLPHGLGSAIPQGHAAAVAEAEVPVAVRVSAGVAGPVYSLDAGGRGVWQEVALAELRPTLERVFSGRAEGLGRTMLLEGDRSLSFAQMAAVVGEGKAAGAGAIALVGRQK
jgi:biopolymer transport protein ExbD